MTKKGKQRDSKHSSFSYLLERTQLQKQSIFKILIFLFTLCGKQLWIQ